MSRLLDTVCAKYHLDPNGQSPLVVPDAREGGLTALWRDWGFCEGAEIGVEQGHFSERICLDNPQLKLHCIDPWQEYRRYENVRSQAKMEGFYAEAVERLKPYPVEMLRLTSLEAAKHFAPESLDFVYIDADHELSHVIADIAAWTPLVKRGGIIAGHDYTPEKHNHRIPLHVMQAVDAWTSAYRIAPWFLWKNDDGPSWMWEKP